MAFWHCQETETSSAYLVIRQTTITSPMITSICSDVNLWVPPLLMPQSLSTSNYTIPRLQPKFDKHAFLYTRAAALHELPHEPRPAPSLASLKRYSEGYLFNTALNTELVESVMIHCSSFL